MTKKLLISGLLLFLFCLPVFGQITVQGIVRDAGNSEVLIDATIEDTLSGNWALSDEKGRFTLIVPEKTRIIVNFIGYTGYSQEVEKDTFLNIYLSPSVLLDDVVVTETSRKKNPSVSTMRALDITNIPTLAGKPDIIKALQTLPGIQGTHEGSAEITVRGGSPGENAYYLDGAPLIYVNHLAGILSVFNTEMINSIDVYKGGFPSRHGGKLSSIVDIHQNSGNKKKFQGNLSLGITDLSGSLQGPIIKDKLSFIVSARKTLFDYLLLYALSHSDDPSKFYYGFHDINGKLTYNLNQRNTLSLNIYQGDDYFKVWNKTDEDRLKLNNVWGNVLVSANWDSFLGNSLVGNTLASYTNYRLKDEMYFGAEDFETERENSSSLGLLFLSSGWNKTFSNQFNLRFGGEARINRSYPLKSIVDNQVYISSDALHYGNLTAYLEPEYEFHEKLKLSAGLRTSYYDFLNDGEFYLDPRLRLEYVVDKRQEISASYMRVHQFEHMFSVIGNIGLNQVWIPADELIPVSMSDQVSLGYRNSQYDGYLLKTAVYYKWMRDLSDYKEGFLVRLGDLDYSNKIVRGGIGNAYGFEFLLRKEKGAWTGSVSYAYQRSFRQFETVNGSRPFPYDYDRPHNFNILVQRRLGEKWKLSAGWYFHSGMPHTPVIGKQYTPDEPDNEGNVNFYEALIYGDKNSGRMVNYHRLDLSASYTKFYPTGEKWKELTFGLYNAYYRNNPYYYFYNAWGGDIFSLEIYDPRTSSEGFLPLKEVRVNYFPIIPHVSYKWYLK